MSDWLLTALVAFGTFLFGAVCGAVIEIVVDEAWGSPIRRWIKRYRRTRARRGSRQALHRPKDGHLLLGNHDTHTILIDGTGHDWYDVTDIRCDFEGELLIPDSLADAVREVEERVRMQSAQGKFAPWNGSMAAVHSFQIGRKGENEARTLRLHCKSAQYFHFLAVNLPLYNEWTSNPSCLVTRERTLGQWRREWTRDMPPGVVGGIPVNLLVLTDDGFLVFGNRSGDVAIAPNVVACAINENLHAFKDRQFGRPALSIDSLLRRAIHEELGYSSESRILPVPEPRILAFTVHTGNCGHGLAGYVRLGVEVKELESLYQSRATDRWEMERNNPFIAVKADVESVCKLIHQRRLYDSVGVAAYLTLVCEGADPAAIHSCLRGFQGR